MSIKLSTSLSLYQRLRYGFLFPSLFWSWLRSLIWPMLYSFTLSFILITPFKTDHPGYFLISSMAALLVGTYGSMALSSRIINLGYELRGYHLYNITRLWSLAFRAFLLPILLVFVITPGIFYVMADISEFPYRLSWLLPINLFLLHLLFTSVAVYTTLSPNQSRLSRILYLVACPYHILVGPVMVGSFWLLVIFGNILRAFWDGWSVLVTALLDKLANLADTVLLIPAIGPVVMFWLNPYFLLIRLHAGETYSTSAPFAFAGVCVLIISVIWVRVRSWLNINMESFLGARYDEWLEIRATVPFETWENITNVRKTQQANREAATPRISNLEHNILTDNQRPAGPLPQAAPTLLGQFTLPKADCPEAYLISLNQDKSIWPPRWTYVFFAASVAAALFLDKMWLFSLPALWTIFTCLIDWQVDFFSSITPQSVRKWLQILLRQHVKLIPFDILVALIIPAVFTMRMQHALLGLSLILCVRLSMLALKIAYCYQLVLAVTVALIVAVGSAIGGMVCLVGIEIEPDSGSYVYLICPSAMIAGVAITWALLSFIIWRKYNGLVHKAIIRQSGQM